MKIQFKGRFKSITSFEWSNIPKFVIITGPNGSGKSQLLELLYNSIINKSGTYERVEILDEIINPGEVIFLKGEWHLQNTVHTNLSTIQAQLRTYYQNFHSDRTRFACSQHSEHQLKLQVTIKDIVRKIG